MVIYTIIDRNNFTTDEILISCVGVDLFGVGWREIDVDVSDDLYLTMSDVNKLA